MPLVCQPPMIASRMGFILVKSARPLPIGSSYTELMVMRSEEHTSELQSPCNLVCRLLLEKKKMVGMEKSSAGSVRVRTAPRQVHVLGVGVCVAIQRAVGGGVSVARSFPRGVFFFNDTATTEIYTLSLHDALPICQPFQRVNADEIVQAESRQSFLV